MVSKRYFINSKGLELFNIVVNDSVGNLQKYFILMVNWKYLGIGGQYFGMREEVLSQSENRTNCWIIGVLKHMPRIIGYIYRLINFRSSKILNQTILSPLDVLHMHIDTVVASRH